MAISFAEHLRAQHRAGQADGDLVLPLRHRERLEARGVHDARVRRHLRIDGGVVDEDVDGNSAACKLLVRGAHRLERSDVDRKDDQIG
ncbi:hypothetical protein ACVWW5_003077 [Bradyrhizobium sp. LM3.4]